MLYITESQVGMVVVWVHRAAAAGQEGGEGGRPGASVVAEAVEGGAVRRHHGVQPLVRVAAVGVSHRRLVAESCAVAQVPMAAPGLVHLHVPVAQVMAVPVAVAVTVPVAMNYSSVAMQKRGAHDVVGIVVAPDMACVMVVAHAVYNSVPVPMAMNQAMPKTMS